MKDFDAWLKALVSTLGSTDRALAEEIRAIHGSRSFAAGARSLPASVRNIVLRVGRPVLAIVGNAPRLDFKDSESAAQLRTASGTDYNYRYVVMPMSQLEVMKTSTSHRSTFSGATSAPVRTGMATGRYSSRAPSPQPIIKTASTRKPDRQSRLCKLKPITGSITSG